MQTGIKNISNATYEKATPKDEQEIINLLQSLNGDRANFDINKFYVAKNEEEIIGCVRIKVFDGGCLELASLAVQPNYQNQGVGSKLVTTLLQAEISRPIFLLTSLDKESFYKKFDFAVVEPLNLPDEFKKEYDKIISLPFAKGLEVIAMINRGNKK